MRVSSLQVFQNGVRNISVGQQNIADLQNKISTGKNLLRPSDDPVAAAQILKLQRELSATETYNENITVSERRLNLEEISLTQIHTATVRLKELSVQAGNGVLNSEDLAGIANEVKEIQSFILGIMNTRDAQGEYLFAGAKGKTRPFVESSPGNFTYQGDTEVRFIQTGPEAFAQSSDSGRDVFQTIQGTATVSALNAPAGFGLTVTDSAQLETYLAANGKADLTLNLTATGNYDLLDGDGVSIASGGPLAAGATVDLTATLGISFTMPTPLVDAGAPSANPAVSLRPEVPVHSLLTSTQNFHDELLAAVTPADITAAVDKMLSELDQGQAGLIKYQTQIGGRLVALEQQKTVNQDFGIFTKAALSELEDLDFAEALSSFSFQEVALQAAQQTFSRVSNLSLFQFL